MSSEKRKEAFFTRVLRSLGGSDIPFMVAGTYAFMFHTRSTRPTKDLDIFCRPKDVQKLLKFAKAQGFKTERTYASWLGKIYDSENYVDVVFRSSNRRHEVDDGYLRRSMSGIVLGVPTKVVSPEDMLVTKLYVMSRDCFHGHDVYKLIKALKLLDWKRIWTVMEKDWQILYAHVLLFDFVFPRERKNIPQWLRKELALKALKPARTTAVFQGNDLSLVDYKTPKQLQALHNLPKK